MHTSGFRAKSVLCCLLVLQLHLWPAACSLPALPGPDGWLTVAINPGDTLDVALKGSVFEGARAMAVNVWTHQFRIAAPGGQRELSGAVGDSTHGSIVRTLRVSEGSAWADAELDSNAKLALLKTSAGHSWQRPSDWTSAASGDEETLHDALMNANADMIVVTQALDAAAQHGSADGGASSADGNSGNPAAKLGSRSQAINGDLSGVLGVLAVLLGVQLLGANFPIVYFLIQVVVSISLTMSLLNLSPGGTPTPTGGTPTPNNSGGTPGTGGTSTTADATLRVNNVLVNSVPIWYVVPLPLAGEQAIGNLLGDEGIPAGGSRDFKVPAGTRAVNIIVPTDTDCLRVYQWKAVILITGEVTELVQSNEMSSALYPSDCGG